MQVILGSGGAIGTELAKALPAYTDKIRLFARHPRQVNPTDELMKGDVLSATDVDKAIAGCEVAYLCVGFKYDIKVWRSSWPLCIQIVMDACMKHGCKLVFFDNIYMYDSAHLHGMTEECPINPPTEKGKVRKQVADAIMTKVKEGKLKALIARSADFYGPGIKDVSMLTETVFKPLSQGKQASWLSAMNFPHSFTFTPDAGKATALLGNTEDAYNQVWHLPTAHNPMTGREWIDAIAKAMGIKPKSMVLSPFSMVVLGIFIPVMREIRPMMYQYDRPYVFSSAKFSKRFGIEPTSYAQGVQQVVEADYKK